MKHKEIERLKEIDRLREKLGDEFELITQSPDENDKFFVVIAKKKDPWEGVEFVECLQWVSGGSFKKGVIYPMSEIKCFGGGLIELNGQEKDFFKPSTETAYVDQLKKEAFERYGDIHDLDQFDVSPLGLGNQRLIFVQGSNPQWYYDKKEDSLQLGGFRLYQYGKWAKKLPERVKVEWLYWYWTSQSMGMHNHVFKVSNLDWDKAQNKDDIGEYLAKALEEYINKEAGI